MEKRAGALNQDCFVKHTRSCKSITFPIKLLIEGSPDPDSTSPITKKDKILEVLLEGSLQDLPRLSKSEANYSENLRSPINDYKFTKETSPNKSKGYLSSKHSSKRCTPILQKPTHKISKSLKLVPEIMESTPKIRKKVIKETDKDSLKVTPKTNTQNDEYSKMLIEVIELKKLLSKQQHKIKAKDKKIKEVTGAFEQIIEELENYNRNLLKELNCLKKPKENRVALLGTQGRKSDKLQDDRLLVNGNLLDSELNSELKQEIIYANGAKSEKYPNGYTVMHYSNKDIKQVYPDGKQVYFFANEQTAKTIYPDGVQEIIFSSGQREKTLVDGTKEIKFVDGSTTYIFPNGEAETVFPNGKIEKFHSKGLKTVIHVDGRKETFYR